MKMLFRSTFWSKMWLHTRTDYKFGLSGFPLYEINMTTKSAIEVLRHKHH